MFHGFIPRPRRRKTGFSRHCYRPLVEALEDRNLLSAGVLDPTFGSGGFAVIHDSALTHWSLAIQPDGKLLEVGQGSTFFQVSETIPDGQLAGNWQPFVLFRQNSDGSPDSSFGTNGRIYAAAFAGGLSGPGDNSLGQALGFVSPSAVTVGADGKIIVAGSIEYGWAFSGPSSGPHPPGLALPAIIVSAPIHHFFVGRFNSDGTVDTSFGNGGMSITPLGNDDVVSGVAVLPDGRIVAAGTSDWNFAAVRYNVDGSLDQSFGNGGRVVTTVGLPHSDLAHGLAVQSDGKVVLAGSSVDVSHAFNATLARFNGDGSLDSTFGAGGIVETHIPVLSSSATDIALDADGNIVVAGWYYFDFRATPYPNDLPLGAMLLRYTPDGQLDTSFGNHGQVQSPNDMGVDLYYPQVALQANGRILLGSNFANATNGTLMKVTRYDADGSLDVDFGNGGKAVASQGIDTPAFQDDLLVQPDGGIVVAGWSYRRSPAEFHIDLTLVRFANDEGAGPLQLPPPHLDVPPVHDPGTGTEVPVAPTPPLPPQDTGNGNDAPVLSAPPQQTNTDEVPPSGPVNDGTSGTGGQPPATLENPPIVPPVQTISSVGESTATEVGDTAPEQQAPIGGAITTNSDSPALIPLEMPGFILDGISQGAGGNANSTPAQRDVVNGDAPRLDWLDFAFSQDDANYYTGLTSSRGASDEGFEIESTVLDTIYQTL